MDNPLIPIPREVVERVAKMRPHGDAARAWEKAKKMVSPKFYHDARVGGIVAIEEKNES